MASGEMASYTAYIIRSGDKYWCGRLPDTYTYNELRLELYNRFHNYTNGTIYRKHNSLVPYSGAFPFFTRQHTIEIIPEEEYDITYRTPLYEDNKGFNEFLSYTCTDFTAKLIDKARHAVEYDKKKNGDTTPIDQNLKIVCPCGGCYTRKNKKVHERTARHRAFFVS